MQLRQSNCCASYRFTRTGVALSREEKRGYADTYFYCVRVEGINENHGKFEHWYSCEITHLVYGIAS
ncbi:hypothetical protein CY34DRAFT_802755 [Suillus luteus UH-Slu-Lm8-n1]|uniref:Unplaced genomic scaffold CY34scaffold_61, whole genome shotgun sequence n=1 Tax=Suillus luteus UH-Slu-Lm8-n1 TaxID=930992 RepID=A0A0D0BM28_9AGAM|nr:hypothetical protein CY34DRAFT_802755 [Suillus luteus UH-Slu-Lm8-n1]